MNTQNIPAGAPCWIDLMTSDMNKSRDFYTALFGWSYETGDEEKYGGYTMAYKDGKSVAGLMQSGQDAGGQPDIWSTYLRVDDMAASMAAAKNAGAMAYMEPMDVPEQGSMAMIGDPSGAAVGLWQFGGHTGFQAHEENGAAAWHELHSKDYRAAVSFYRDVFGVETSVMSDTDEFRYTNMVFGGKELAGIMDASQWLPDESPSSWQVYFQTDDVDATIAKALTLGATIINSAEDSPYGRIAGLTDCTGAMFKLVQPQS
ncbi:Putative hydroxylase [Arthrobacter sp. PAMC 25486]|uniref:VOC family protein n=1 Tax=Arthrobacter sp. PAMC 25486 TaxID=1494608 RepID=UPI000535DB48|nr:VOC family protein [Arthrobacter sp. PAMC 25486]AIY01833.1 Putative hydroxylase [Arthrobacter sp. PAMC 25486]